MAAVRASTRAAMVALLVAAPAVWYACTDHVADSTTGPVAAAPDTPVAVPNLLNAVAALRRHSDALLASPGVVGTAVTHLADGRSAVLLLLERSDIAGLPPTIDGVPVTTRVTGRIMAFSDPTKRARPAPPGYSVGHPAITAGTIGARVRDALGRVYILSNNHVLANSNNATLGDPEYQPGPYDGGTAADQIATLTDFQTITFGSSGSNTIDAAIALSSPTLLDNATPTDDGYGMPNATIFDDANGDGLFDDPNTLLGLNVQKYGRTTKLTHGQITGINATVTVCYEVSGFDCIKSARYVDQLIIAPSGFSGGGDSGSLIVTDDGNLQPVGLLFAGSSTVTIANRIDLVLARFGVTIDGFAPPPPGPVTDLAVTALNTPNTVVQGTPTAVTVAVKNFGNQDVSSPFNVTLQDTTDHVTVGTQSVAALTAGAGTTLTFTWTPSSTGDHVLVASQSLIDDKPTNDRRYATVPVDPPLTDIAVTSMTGGSVIVGHTINVGVTVGNVGNQNVASAFTVTLRDSTSGATIGTQSVAGLAVGASATLTFSWNTTGAVVGGHTLVASHDFTDGNLANNQRSTVITVNPKPLDLAVTGITGPARVTQGDTAHVLVTVGNVGERDATTSFTVVLTDGTAGGALLGTQTVAGLVVGDSVKVDFPWNTAGADTTGHILFATQQLADDNASNNTVGIGIIVQPRPTTDLAVTAVNAPTSVIQGSITPVGVTVQNVGGVNVSSSFTVTLTDATAGVTIGTQTVAGLAAGAGTSLTFNWNTTGIALGGHTLVATQSLADGNAANNQRSTAVTVTAPVTDVAVTSVAAPGSVIQGSPASVSVTVQNVGGQNVGTTFHLVLTDSTSGVTIGTQSVAGLAAGASATLTFSWTTTNAALGSHTLVARHDLSDDNLANNQRSTVIMVNPKPLDLAVTGITGPARVTQGDTAHVLVTVKNVGGRDATTSFNVVLTDGTAGGALIGTQTVPGLVVGDSVKLDFPWNTAGADTVGHILFATQQLADDNASNNTVGIGIIVQPRATTDLAVTAVNAPASVLQGSTTPVGVTVQNVGGVNVSTSFTVTLTDATAGVTIGTQTVAGLAAGASTSLSFSWNTTGATLGGHTLVATQSLADANAANNQRSTAVTVTAPVTDVAVTSVAGPASVTQGSTTSVGVTVQNVGGVNVSTSFTVTLTDSTAGVTIGSQSVTGLTAGASATLSFSWNTTGATLGGHTLVATQSLADGNAANDRRSSVVTVTAPPVDLALTGITGPPSVTQGDTAVITATVQNVGGVDVSTGFDVVLTDGSAGGGVIGTQTIPGLAAGASITRSFSWNTAGVTATSHILIATQKLADNNPSNNAGAIGITVNPPSVHVGNLDGAAASNGNNWSATVVITAHDWHHVPINGVTVGGSWNGSGQTVQCVTGTSGSAGTCSVVLAAIPNGTRLVSFAVSNLVLSGYVYKSSMNHDPDGSSNGFSIYVQRK